MTALLLLAAGIWDSAPVRTLALQRTPPLYSTDAPAALDIPNVRMQVLRQPAKTLVRLQWADPSQDVTSAANLFFDACSLMVPAKPAADGVFPSLQMGDAEHPVILYYYDAVRGAAVLEASGRGTTKRTGKTFPTQASHTSGGWTVTFEIPPLSPGTPVSVAVWNGNQQDRDGRKYFTIWHKTP